ncbi:hypothetical protein G3580_03210 [Nitrogeniibacter mangrovi]|uniref:Uncharacterized protein n=1 Tax=Nitrogeniibacter mangrovi TaxID=2016596 RepID=A0A6C1AZE2_9RHOO|nr:hypothetical protein [Nitrogeniibacter mangrovi]QID16726.1 hypothetical protein G3580_03210 [Nitrogeniibacter mangrovi]
MRRDTVPLTVGAGGGHAPLHVAKACADRIPMIRGDGQPTVAGGPALAASEGKSE